MISNKYIWSISQLSHEVEGSLSMQKSYHKQKASTEVNLYDLSRIHFAGVSNSVFTKCGSFRGSLLAKCKRLRSQNADKLRKKYANFTFYRTMATLNNLGKEAFPEHCGKMRKSL